LKSKRPQAARETEGNEKNTTRSAILLEKNRVFIREYERIFDAY